MDPRTVVDLVLDVEAEVNNGGFHQFFNNSSGDNTADTIVALETIGATAMADILKRAAARFPNGFPPKIRSERLAELWNSFSKTDEFWDLDEEFFAYPDDLSGLIAAYKDQFSDYFPQTTH